MFVLPLLLLAATAVHALMPVAEDRFLAGDSSWVSSWVESPADYDMGSKVVNVLTKATNGSSGTVLNLAPGISLLATDVNNECYFVNTTIGTHEFPLIIDTGSAYLWVYGDDCSDSICESEAVYTPTSSATSTASFALAYVTGTASGEVLEDSIIVNKLATTQKFRFGVASEVPEFFARYPVSGIFGLPASDSSAMESITTALYNSHAIGHRRFSISLGAVGDSDQFSNAGVFAMGEPVEELYTGEIHYNSLVNTSDSYWKISVDAINVNGYTVAFNESVEVEGSNSSIARVAIVDSGTTVLALPAQDALDVHALFPQSLTDGTNFAILCNTTLDITLTMGQHNWTLTPQQFLGDSYATDSIYAGYCVSNIQGVDSLSDWILGAVFLKTVYADFDVENQQVGFATRNEHVIITSTSTQASATGHGNTTWTASSASTASASSSASSSSSLSRGTGAGAAFGVSSLLLALCALL